MTADLLCKSRLLGWLYLLAEGGDRCAEALQAHCLRRSALHDQLLDFMRAKRRQRNLS